MANRSLRFSLAALVVAGLCAGGAIGCGKKAPLDLTITGELKEGDSVRDDDNTFFDTHTFNANEGDTVTVVMTADDPTSLDTYILVANPDGTEAGQNDDCNNSDPAEGSCLTFVATQKGTYSVDANSYDDSTNGAYTLRITSTLAQ